MTCKLLLFLGASIGTHLHRFFGWAFALIKLLFTASFSSLLSAADVYGVIQPDSSFHIEASLRPEAMRSGISDVVDQNYFNLGVRGVVVCTLYEDASFLTVFIK